MFSVSPAEMLTIAVVALLVFGPKRLPEIARKAGRLLREVRGAASELTSGLEEEYREAIGPLEDARDTMRKAISGIERPEPQRPAVPAPEAADPETTAPEPPESPPAGDDGEEIPS